MKPDELTQAVCDYLKEPTDRYAIMITGAWGSGKTHYIDNTLKEALDDLGHPLVRVSLFGVSAPEEFHDRLLAPALASRFTEIVDAGAEATGSDQVQQAVAQAKGKRGAIAEKIYRFKGVAADFSLMALQTFQKQFDLQLSIATQSITDLLLGEKVVLVLDDLERCELSETQILGLLDTMIEAQGKKVILLANENKLKEKLSEEGGSTPKQGEYSAVKEKLVWRTFSFEPDINAIVQDLFHEQVSNLVNGSDAVAIRVLQECVDATRSLSENNLRVYKRGMLICGELKKTNFFANASRNSNICDGLADLLGLAIYTSRRAINDDKVSVQGDLSEDYLDQTGSEIREDKLALLPFIRQYLVDGIIHKSSTITTQLEEFMNAYHPDNELALGAVEAIAKWRHRVFRNVEVPSMIDKIEQSLVSPLEGGLSFDRYRDAIEVINDIQTRLPECGVDESDIVEKMKMAINADLEGAIRSVESEPLIWQEVEDIPSDIKRLSSMDELREHIRSAALTASAKSLSLSRSEAGVIPFDSLLEILKRERGVTQKTAVLLSLEPEDAAQSLQAYNVEELHRVHHALRGYELRDMLVRSAKSSELQEWFRILRIKLDRVKLEEIANDDVLSWIRNDISNLFRFMRSVAPKN